MFELQSYMRTCWAIGLFFVAASCVAASMDAPAFGAKSPIEQAEATLNEAPITSIFMRRLGCYGTCPIYDVELHYDGFVEYNGLRFVDYAYKHTRLVPVEDFKSLEADLYEIDFFNLRDRYVTTSDGCGPAPTDGPSVEIEVARGGRTKRVRLYLNCRSLPATARINALADRIDAIAKTKEWVKSE
jgi:hypothetical protein